MDIEKIPLNSNHYLDEFDEVSNWTHAAGKSKTCAVCHNTIKDDACQTEPGLECVTCVVANIKNCVTAEKTDGYTLYFLRQAMSRPHNLRWRFLFLTRFNDIYQQEKQANHFALETLLIGQLGYVTAHPLSQQIRQLAVDVCLSLGEGIVPLLIKLYRQHPWQFLINVVVIAGTLGPYYTKVDFIIDQASEHSNLEVRKRVISLLTEINNGRYSWVKKILLKMCADTNPAIREIARKQAAYQPPPVKKKQKIIKPIQPVHTEQKTGRDLMDLYEEFRLKRTRRHIEYETVITDIYTATGLKKIFTSLLIPLFEEHKLIENYVKPINRIKKNYLVAIFTYIILDRHLLQLMLDQLSTKAREIFTSFVWQGGTRDINELETELGLKILASSRGGYYRTVEIINPDFLLFQTEITSSFYEMQSSIHLHLDNGLRSILKRSLPLPELATIKSLDEVPNHLYIYYDENQFAAQVDIFLEYMRQGNIQTAKNSQYILKPSLKKWMIYFNIKNFYPEKDKDFQYLVAYLVMDFLIQAKAKNINMTQNNSVKNLILEFFNLKNFKKYRLYNLLSHIQGYFFISNESEKEVRLSAFELLKSLCKYNWISIENLVINLECHNKSYYFSLDYEDEHYLYTNLLSKDRYSRFHESFISRDNYYDVFFTPLVKGMFFFFASLGLVDIAYDDPRNDKYYIYDKSYLSVYDGLKYVRISEFGKYILDAPNNYDLKSEKQATKIILDEKRLIVTIEGDGRLQRLILNQLAEPIGENNYKISFDSFLKNCSSKKDIKNKISVFKERLSPGLPFIWQEFFKEIEEKINPLQIKDDTIIYKFKPGKQLISLFARDEIFKANILKVEDYHIAIERRNLYKVKKRLREFGYFIDNM